MTDATQRLSNQRPAIDDVRGGNSDRLSDDRPFQCRGPIRILRLSQVMDMVGFRRAHIYKLLGEGRFPKRIHIGQRAVGWVEEEIQAWRAQKIQARTPSSE